jgi:hypothetical protein
LTRESEELPIPDNWSAQVSLSGHCLHPGQGWEWGLSAPSWLYHPPLPLSLDRVVTVIAAPQDVSSLRIRRSLSALLLTLQDSEQCLVCGRCSINRNGLHMRAEKSAGLPDQPHPSRLPCPQSPSHSPSQEAPVAPIPRAHQLRTPLSCFKPLQLPLPI